MNLNINCHMPLLLVQRYVPGDLATYHVTA